METNTTNPHKNKVHRILAHSYLIQFIFFLVGVCLDSVYKLKISPNPILVPAGLTLLILGTILVIWAQKTTHNLKPVSLDKEPFFHGPYKYTRSPTHVGLFLLMFGFGIMINAWFVVILSLISFAISKFSFLHEQEKILEQKYGAPYSEYKKAVRF